MINQTHFVLDLETMGNGPNAAIVAIGCVRIDRGQITNEFYRRVNLESAIKHGGGEVDGDTIRWWLDQAEDARAEILAAEPTDYISDALVKLDGFMGWAGADPETILVWGNGASFDNVILASAYRRYSLPTPWRYWNDRDLRTLLALYPEAKQAVPFEGTKHHALHDARHEAKLLCWVLNKINSPQSTPAIPAGHVVVPIEPTPAMVAAAEEAHMPFGDMDIALRCAAIAGQRAMPQDVCSPAFGKAVSHMEVVE